MKGRRTVYIPCALIGSMLHGKLEGVACRARLPIDAEVVGTLLSDRKDTVAVVVDSAYWTAESGAPEYEMDLEWAERT